MIPVREAKMKLCFCSRREGMNRIEKTITVLPLASCFWRGFSWAAAGKKEGQKVTITVG